jgi:hypothetical protein
VKQSEVAFPPTTLELVDPTFVPFSEEEVQDVISKLKDKKAAGPDGLCNEHLKDSKFLLLTVWTELYDKCMELGTIPHKWRQSMVKVMYKGKGDTNDTGKYRGIALECSPFKVLTRLLETLYGEPSPEQCLYR